MRPLLLALLLVIAAPVEARELLRNGHFTALDGWWATPNLTMKVGKAGLCVDVPGGTANPWDAIIGQDGLKLQRGQPYRLAVRLSGDAPVPVAAQLQLREAPYTPLLQRIAPAPAKPELWQIDAIAAVDAPEAQLAIQLGGSPTPWRFCLKEASVRDDITVVTETQTPAIRVNQLGYLPQGPKRATLVTTATAPVEFAVKDAAGQTVITGTSAAPRRDPTSALNVAILDFSELTAEGKGFTLAAGGATSYPFAIAADLYAPLRKDAFSFFYPMRSGIAIDGTVAGAAYARAAGHLGRPGGDGPNQGDYAVPCRPAAPPPDEPDSDCAYTLDATGGWYDAGDQGKYVVNGAVSVAEVLLAYERDPQGLGDRSLAVPETGNGQPDALDEARWELDWMLKMVVPSGPLAGLLHSKVSDDQWTGIPTLPADDPRPRELHAPSTAATLDFAAAAAIGARVYSAVDPDYAAKLLGAARAAYAAARAHPDQLILSGGYEDRDLRDEVFWAAAELYLATQDAAYLADLKASPGWGAGADLYVQDGYSWQQVAPLAALELARHADRLAPDDAALWTGALRTGADRLLALQQGEAFGQSLTPSDGRFGWGSNAQALSNALVLAAATDVLGDARYRNAAIEAADYLLGRNGLGQSYVTGYGTQFSHNQHSRWFAHSRDPRLPPPPDGALAGGPNAGLQDPVMQARFAAAPCAPQLCYVDDIGAYSVNEIAINWNAALAFFGTWLALQH